MKKLVLVTLSFFVLFAAVAQKSKAPKNIKHVILIGFDGLGAYSFPHVKAPNIRKLMQEGSWTLHARSILPSSSAANWASMYMGAGPELHGYSEWNTRVPDPVSIETDKYGMFPSIFSVIREQKPSAEMGIIYDWEGIKYLFPEKALNYAQQASSDSVVADSAILYIKEKKPDFFMVYFGEPDGVGHNIGHATPEYYAEVEKCDAYVGKIVDAIEKAGIMDETVIILSSDHGGIKKGHGGKSMAEMEIPWIICGKGIKQNTELKESVMIYDTAPTIAYLFGLKPPQVWRGKTVTEAFK